MKVLLLSQSNSFIITVHVIGYHVLVVAVWILFLGKVDLLFELTQLMRNPFQYILSLGKLKLHIIIFL